MSRGHRLTRLTTRGRSFLAAGAATLTLGSLAGLTELVRIGVFVLVLPLGSILWVALRRHGLMLTRSGVPTHLPVGDSASIVLRIQNPATPPTGLLLMTERVPAPLGGPPRFAVESLRHGAARRVGYEVRGVQRGKYEVGPLEARVVDPFGFVQRQEVFPGTRTVVVTPRVVDLAPVALPTGPIGVGERKARQFLTGSADDSTVRDYRRGDDLRRVHWRSSAHHNELMVRSEEQPWRSRATVVLDTRSQAFPTPEGAAHFETAVSFVASIALHLLRREFTVRLVTNDGTHLTREWLDRRSSAFSEGEILENLALVELRGNGYLASNLAAGTRPGDLTIGVFGELSRSDLVLLEPLSVPGSWNIAFTTAGGEGPGSPWVWAPVLPHSDLSSEWVAAATRLRTGRRPTRETA